jgi:hypothetical protein
VEEGARQRVERALRQSGGQLLPFRVARDGLTVAAVRKPARAKHS